MSVTALKNESKDSTADAKFITNKPITQSMINLGKLRNRKSTDDLRLTVRYSTAALSTLIQLVQFAKF